MKDDCPRIWEREAHREGRLSAADAIAYQRHLTTCTKCAASAAEAAQLSELAHALVTEPPDEIRVRRVRASLLRAAAHEAPIVPARGARMVPAAAALAFVAAVTVWMIPLGPSPSPTGGASSERAGAVETATVAPGPDAVWSRNRDGATERVRLDEGSLGLEVRHRSQGERFLVELPDGELEVHGTRFQVNVRAGATQRVQVFEGRVALRRRGEVELLIDAGQTWDRPRTPTPPTDDAPRKAAPSSVSARPTPPAQSDARVYADAMALYSDGKFEEAARAFRAFVAAHPALPEAEDASFLEAAAIAQAGRGDAAGLLAERFLERHPGSFHAKDAAVLVARAARERGDCDAARKVLAPWLSPPTPVVTTALGRCAVAP